MKSSSSSKSKKHRPSSTKKKTGVSASKPHQKKNDDILLVPLGKIVREHGFAKEGVRKWKVELFQKGGDSFRELKRVYLFNEPKSHKYLPQPASKLNATEISLLSACESLGAKWGNAPAVLLSLKETEDVLKKWVAVARADFPDSEDTYLVDLLGWQVFDPADKAKRSFTIESIENTSQISGVESWIAILKNGAKEFSVPLQALAGGSDLFARLRSDVARKPVAVEALLDWEEAAQDLNSDEVPDHD